MKVRHTILQLAIVLGGEMLVKPKSQFQHLDYHDNSVEFDITYPVQHAHANGNDSVNLGFWVVDDNTTDDWRFASSDYTNNEDNRPKVALNWRTGVQWLPSQATGLHPADGSTLWNNSASRPMVQNPLHIIGRLENLMRQGG